MTNLVAASGGEEVSVAVMERRDAWGLGEAGQGLKLNGCGVEEVFHVASRHGGQWVAIGMEMPPWRSTRARAPAAEGESAADKWTRAPKIIQYLNKQDKLTSIILQQQTPKISSKLITE